MCRMTVGTVQPKGVGPQRSWMGKSSKFGAESNLAQESFKRSLDFGCTVQSKPNVNSTTVED